MKKMMNILLPTDFSENAKNAAEYALQFFRNIPCTFYFLHVLPVPSPELLIQNISMPIEVKQKFDELLKDFELQKLNKDHIFNISYKANYFVEAVREQVKIKNIDLILMGTKGSTNHKAVVVGKHTADVIMKVKCPTLAISEKAIFKDHKEVLFPTDYKINYNSKMLETLWSIIRLSNASVKILELFNSEMEPSAEQLANRLFLQNSFFPEIPRVQTYYSLKPSDKDSIFSSNENVDMIVMAAKNVNLCQRLLRNQSSEQIPMIRQLPLLILHG